MNVSAELEQYLLPAFWVSDEFHSFGIDGVDGASGMPSGAVCFASSGSSGVEKWVVHTRASLLCSAQAVNEHLQITEADVWGLLLPHYHVGGFGVLARSYAASVRCAIYSQKWNPVAATDFLETEGVTVTSLVPTQVYDLVQSGMRAPITLRAVLVGGGALSDEVGQQARDLGWPVLQTYGMSEAGSQVATASLESLEQRFSSTQLLILPIWDVSMGESLTIKGGALCAGIMYKDKAEFRYVSHAEYTSSDQVEIIGNRLTFIQRLDRTVKIKGELVNIDELERTLVNQAGAKVIIIATPDPRSGNSLHGFSEVPVELGDLNQWLPPFAQLESCLHMESLPKSALGKVDRRALKPYTI